MRSSLDRQRLGSRNPNFAIWPASRHGDFSSRAFNIAHPQRFWSANMATKDGGAPKGISSRIMSMKVRGVLRCLGKDSLQSQVPAEILWYRI